MNRTKVWAATAAALLVLASCANADLIWQWDGGNGLSGTAQFRLVDAQHLQVTVLNTSTGIPASLAGSAANQILTSISFDFANGASITDGSAVLGAGAQTLNFDNVTHQLLAGADVSSEWGFTNTGNTMSMGRNAITSMAAQSTPFTTSLPNLDGPVNLDGPQGGLVATPPVIGLGGLGGIEGPVIFSLSLSKSITLGDLSSSTGILEFGSDAAFVGHPTAVPEPATLGILVVGGAAFSTAAWRKHRRRHQTTKKS